MNPLLITMKHWARFFSVTMLVLAVIALPLNPAPALVMLLMAGTAGWFGWRNQ